MIKKQKPSEFEVAIKALEKIPQLDEKQRFELLLEMQAELNDSDAAVYFDRWFEAVCVTLGIELEKPDPNHNPFA